MRKSDSLRRTFPLGIFRDGNSVALIGRETYATTSKLITGQGEGKDFQLSEDPLSIILPLGRREQLSHISSLHLSRIVNQRIMTYSVGTADEPSLRLATYERDEDIETWNVAAINPHLRGHGAVVSEYQHNGEYVLVYGQNDLRLAFSRNGVTWHSSGQAIAKARKNHFDKSGLQFISADYIEQGLLVLYESREKKRGAVTISIGAVLCSSRDPEHVLWRSDQPLHQLTLRETSAPRVLGAIVYEHTIVIYLSSKHEKIITIELPNPYAARGRTRRGSKLHRFAQNPILAPTYFEWESEAVFNPAAFSDGSRVHLLYRAMGPDGISRIGYASSPDGIHFDERLTYPVYTPSHGFGLPSPNTAPASDHYDLLAHPSGGGWAGVEDPRVVAIDSRLYMSFLAFNGWDFMRIALTSISLEDLQHKRWQWRKPVLISKPGETHKNWVVFPEKIHGKYAILHGLSPKIHIDYVDSLDDFDGRTYLSSLPPAGGAGYHNPSRQNHWDNRIRGAGGPPIKTDLGWLLLYHANDKYDPGKYKLGAMLLDLDDPTKVLFRAQDPILEPTEWYENHGKPGVIYTCGAIIMNENLVVYYGGGDKHIGVARANVQEFLDALTAGRSLSLQAAPSVV